MATILEALKAQLDGDPTTIAEAIDIISGSSTHHRTIAAALRDADISGGDIEAYVISFDVNGGTGTVDPIACAEGSTVTLPDGTGITPPTDKELVGWAEANDADPADAVTSYSATASVTLYAVWDDET